MSDLRQFNDGPVLGDCQWCARDAHVKVILRKGTSAKAKNVRMERAALACPEHAERFWREGAEIRS